MPAFTVVRKQYVIRDGGILDYEIHMRVESSICGPGVPDGGKL